MNDKMQKETLKQFKLLIKDLIPNIILRLIKRLRRKNLFEKEDISALCLNFKETDKDESIIIGNGPSLKLTFEKNLDFFKNKTVFCVNNFIASDYFIEIKPKFYVFADPVYWDKKCSERLNKYRETIYRLILEKVNWELHILFPIEAKKWNFLINIPKINNKISIKYYNSTITDTILINKFYLYKKNKALPQSQTVLVAAIFLSLNIGFKRNFIVGADMSLHEGVFVNNNNVVLFQDDHFYDDKKVTAQPFWKNEFENSIFTMAELFQAFSKMFSGFQELEDYSKYLGSKIYNASHKSYIDAFERYDLEKRQPIHES
jgi:hypothetical protein